MQKELCREKILQIHARTRKHFFINAIYLIQRVNKFKMDGNQ